MRIDVDVDGLPRARGRIDSLGDRAADVRPAWRDVVTLLERETEGRFRSRGAGRWAPLDADTIRRKARDRDPRVRGNSSRVLVATGALMDSLTSSGSRYAKRELGPTELRFGSRNPVANVHQGGKGRRKREVLDTRDRTLRVGIADSIRDYLLGRP